MSKVNVCGITKNYTAYKNNYAYEAGEYASIEVVIMSGYIRGD